MSHEDHLDFLPCGRCGKVNDRPLTRREWGRRLTGGGWRDCATAIKELYPHDPEWKRKLRKVKR